MIDAGKELRSDKDEKYKITVTQTPRSYNTIKSWDLCKRCYSSLYRGIEKGVTK